MEPEPEMIVHADEIDEAGADVSILSAATDEELTSQVEERSQEVEDIGPPPSTDEKVASPNREGRSLLRRDGSAPPPPPPPKQPPPPAPSREQGHGSTDSLSLAQLKNIVSTFQRMEPTAYAYNYTDTRTFAEEMEEWFQYTVEDRDLLRRLRRSFEEYVDEDGRYKHSEPWLWWPDEQRENLSKSLIDDLDKAGSKPPARALEALGYIALGGWRGGYANAMTPEDVEEVDFEPPNDRFRRVYGHIQGIRDTARLLCILGGADVVWNIFQENCNDTNRTPHGEDEPLQNGALEALQDEVNRCRDICLSILYAFVETGRWDRDYKNNSWIRRTFIKLEPDFLTFLCQQIARIRWDEDFDLQLTRAVQLLWKGMLLIMGGSKDLQRGKDVLSGASSEPRKEKTHNFLTTTPLDYHLFRQEITSKYPAYNPPPPLIPLEPENISLLPPLPRSSRSNSQSSMNVAPAKFNKSIFDQPVHITTPVPSPPPSPAGPGGKGGKKQNYQTNQHFPFLYPPLDASSNNLGGKGGVALQDKLVGKKWTGSDVPASIQEAGELFASRMRMSRPTRQLWEAREAFVRYDRGWSAGYSGASPEEEDLNEDVQELKLNEDSDEESENLGKRFAGQKAPGSSKTSNVRKETDDPGVQQNLDLADSFYRGSLPHLQSIVIVVLKILLANISATAGEKGANSNHPSPSVPNFPLDQQVDESQLPRYNVNLVRLLSSASNGNGNGGVGSNGAGPTAGQEDEIVAGSFEALNLMRLREITSKAISGMLLTMLKWFRFSHVLKFQFMTQLLLDSNYLPLALKYLAIQDVDRAVDRRSENDRLGFFEFCWENSGYRPPAPTNGTGRSRPNGNGEGGRDDLEDNDDVASSVTDVTTVIGAYSDDGSEREDGEDDEDDGGAVPPPIRRRRRSASPPDSRELLAASEQVMAGILGSGGSSSSTSPEALETEDDLDDASTAVNSTASGFARPPPASRPRRPEVDELGYPTTALPQQPLTTYSARFFFTTITLLRILQKISKNHSHRALLLVQYKSSLILRKALKVPQPALRLYTLKLFKSQVPFCGRKWRQANMRVITAIYVFCRMGLRDDWISGAGQVDDWVDNALTTEQAWRGLTGWWHSRFFRDAVGLGRDRLKSGGAASIGVGSGAGNDADDDTEEGDAALAAAVAAAAAVADGPDEDEEDFFTRELERMGWAETGLVEMDDSDIDEQAEWEAGLAQQAQQQQQQGQQGQGQTQQQGQQGEVW